MKTSLVRGLLIVTMIFAVASWGAAQYGCPTEQGKMKMWNVNAGLFFPIHRGDLSTTFNIGIEHEHPATDIFRGLPGNLTLSLDYASFKTTTTTGSKSVALLPILINWKNHYPLGPEGLQSWFWGIGVGTFWATSSIPDMSLGNGFQFAYDAALGYYFNPSWFLQGRYLSTTTTADSRIFALDLGYSF
jgi:hypothetical protein